MRRSLLVLSALGLLAEAHAQGFYGHLHDPASMSLAEIVGMEVLSAEGRRLGRITDVTFDRATGAVRELAVGAERYPIEALIAGDRPGEVVAERSIEGASAGASALLSLAAGRNTFAVSRELGPPAELVVDLRDGRIRARAPR